MFNPSFIENMAGPHGSDNSMYPIYGCYSSKEKLDIYNRGARIHKFRNRGFKNVLERAKHRSMPTTT